MARLFVALPVADAVRENLCRVGRSLDARGWRWVDQEAMHLTLAFLGEVEERRIAEVEDALWAATEAAASLLLRAQGIGAFPSEAAARVLWAGLDGDVPALVTLRGRLVAELRAAGFTIDAQRFHPHITLARSRWPQPVPARGATRLHEFGEWRVDEAQLVESHLHPSGARYVVRADVPLGDAEG